MKRIVFIVVAAFIVTSTIGQVPQKINYQAVARDVSGAILQNRNISVRLTMHDASATGTIVYQENHAVTTNQQGLFSLAIGGGSVTSGNFGTINWAINDKYLQVEMDPAGGTTYINMGTSQLISVPYAQHAKTVATGDNWGTQTTQTSALLSGNGTSGTPLSIASPGQNYRKLMTDGSGNVTWSTFGGHSLSLAGSFSNAATTWTLLDFSTTQFGPLCSSCKVILRFYSSVARIVYVRSPGDPTTPPENVYDIAAGRSVTVSVQALNGQIEYQSNITGPLKYEFMGFFR